MKNYILRKKGKKYYEFYHKDDGLVSVIFDWPHYKKITVESKKIGEKRIYDMPNHVGVYFISKFDAMTYLGKFLKDIKQTQFEFTNA